MRHLRIVGALTTKVLIILLLFLLALLLFSGAASAQEGQANANAGPDQTLLDSDVGLLDGRQSEGTEGTIFWWEQIDENDPPVQWLVGPNNITATFLPPDVTGDPAVLPLEFRLNAYFTAADWHTDQATVYAFDSNSVITATLAPDGQPIGIGVDPGNLVTFTVIPSDAVTTDVPITGPEPDDVLHGALVDCGIVVTGTTSTVTLFFANQVPPQYDVANLSRRQGMWFDMSNLTVFNPARDVVSYTVTDNADKDEDPTPGIISDPVGLVVMPGGRSGGGGGGGGCFIATAAY